MSWGTSTSQIRHGGNYLTLSENKNENFQSIEKHRENKYTCSVSFTQAFLLVLVPEYDGVSWKHRPCHPERIKRHFLLVTRNPSFIDFKYIYVREILSSWRLRSADTWPAWNKMLCIVCFMLHCTHLHDRYDKSDFFSSDFILLLSCFRGISAKLSKQYYLKFPDNYFFC